MGWISKTERNRLERAGRKLEEVQSEAKDTAKDHKKKVKELERTIDEQADELKVLRALKNDAVQVKTSKLKNEEKEKLLKAREEALEEREESLDLEDTKKYKSGYEDGVADGLRKGYELTADDRQNMASIAALAAASHSDGATQKIAEEIVIGMEKTRATKQLASGKKKS